MRCAVSHDAYNVWVYQRENLSIILLLFNAVFHCCSSVFQLLFCTFKEYFPWVYLAYLYRTPLQVLILDNFDWRIIGGFYYSSVRDTSELFMNNTHNNIYTSVRSVYSVKNRNNCFVISSQATVAKIQLISKIRVLSIFFTNIWNSFLRKLFVNWLVKNCMHLFLSKNWKWPYIWLIYEWMFVNTVRGRDQHFLQSPSWCSENRTEY